MESPLRNLSGNIDPEQGLKVPVKIEDSMSRFSPSTM